MASQEVTLRAGESITLQLETAGKTYRLNLSLTEHGVSVTAPAEAKVEVHASAMAGAGSRSAHREAPQEEPAFEAGQSVDIPASDEESGPVEVAEESQSMSDSEFSLDEESSVAEGTAVDFTSGTQRDSSVDIPDEPLGGADNLSLTGVPGVSHSEDLPLDEPGFTEEGLTMVPPSRHSRQPEPQPEPLLEAEESAQSLDAISATLSPVRFHDPATDNMEQPEMEEKRPPAHGPQLKKPLPGPAQRAPQPAPAPAAQADELPAWTGRARDYRDPKLEAKKAATAKLDKSAITARQQAQPAPAPSLDEDQPLDLALEDEPAPAKKPTAPVPRAAAPAPKPAPMAAKPAPMAPKPAPVAAKPAPAPAAKPAPVAAAKPAPAAPKPAAAPAKAEGNFTVFLSPPKGAEKKQAAAEIISEVQGIDINAATQLAGKMIVPVIKGVTEDEANKVRDRLKDAGLSCRITQKR